MGFSTTDYIFQINLRMDHKIILYFSTSFLFSQVFGYVPVQPNMKSFSSVIKNGILVGDTEQTLFERLSGPGVITEQWFTGEGSMDEDARIRVYIDGETQASLDFMLYLAHGIGVGDQSENQNTPWGTRYFSHLANGGGLFNTFRIPFLKSIKITVTHKSITTKLFWYIVRGVENYPIVLGDVQLPSHTRLRLYKNEDVILKPLEFLTLAQVTNSSGALFLVTLVTNSSSYLYLEACMRAVIDGEKMFLSSGTEDFFLSAYYFNTGIYHTNDAGLTAKDNKGFVSMYKFFERDPILFSKAFELQWRCGEIVGGKDGCPFSFHDRPIPNNFESTSALNETVVTSYVWVYEW